MWRAGPSTELRSSVTWPLPWAQAQELSNVALNSPSICCGLRWPGDKWRNISYFPAPLSCFCNIYFLCWLQSYFSDRWSGWVEMEHAPRMRLGVAELSIPLCQQSWIIWLLHPERAIMDAIAVSEPLHQNFLLINCKREHKNTLRGIHPCQQKFLI